MTDAQPEALEEELENEESIHCVRVVVFREGKEEDRRGRAGGHCLNKVEWNNNRQVNNSRVSSFVQEG